MFLRAALLALPLWGTTQAKAACAPALDFEKRELAGDRVVRLCEEYAGKVVLVVNTASRCAFTDQYDGLEAIYRRYRERGFVVLGFPSNDFGEQEPGSEKSIKQFCRNTYAVEFPMFEKSRVAKGKAEPLFQRLAAEGGGYPRWNFYKYLIDRDGRVVDMYSPMTSPESRRLTSAIEKLL